jgi:hypothetical protein
VTVGVGQTTTSFVYTPAVGNQLPIYNGSNLVITSFSELTITPTSSQVANTIYDVYVINDAGTIRGVIGPAWSNSGAGTGNRGTGAGTAQLALVQGIETNAVSMSAVNGANTYSVPANQGTYVGSIYMDGSNGVVSWHIAIGTNRKVGFWNAYNRQTVVLGVQDATSSWSYASTWRQSRATPANVGTAFVGLPDERVDATFIQPSQGPANGNQNAFNGIGWNSTSVPSGVNGNALNSTSNGNGGGEMVAHYDAPPFIGIVPVFPLEQSTVGNNTFFGGALMLLTIKWNG